jgi:hypothetical protein
MKYIKRWSLMRSVSEENIMEHSQQVAIISHALALIAKENFNKDIDIQYYFYNQNSNNTCSNDEIYCDGVQIKIIVSGSEIVNRYEVIKDE